MSKLDPEKLSVEFREGTTEKAPIIPRRYTLTHSDSTGELYLTIGPDFAFDKITLDRDEVLGEWILMEKGIQYNAYLHVDSDSGPEMETIRYKVFRRELPLALQAIRYGDRVFFETHPEMDHYPIIVYFLYTDQEKNKVEDWGTFADYDITTMSNIVQGNSVMDYLALIDEKLGDVNGDGVPDRISLYGDKEAGSDYINNIIIEADFGCLELEVQMITELSGYNPTLFLGDFTGDNRNDILFNMDTMYNSMNSNDKGKYGAAVYSYKDESFDIIFGSTSYNEVYRYIVEYIDFYKMSILNVRLNKLLFLDISYKDSNYLNQYYNESGKLLKPMQGKVLELGDLIPVVSNQNDSTYDLLAVHRIIGTTVNDTLGYVENLLSWNGKRFDIVNTMVCTPGTYLIPPA